MMRILAVFQIGAEIGAEIGATLAICTATGSVGHFGPDSDGEASAAIFRIAIDRSTIPRDERPGAVSIFMTVKCMYLEAILVATLVGGTVGGVVALAGMLITKSLRKKAPQGTRRGVIRSCPQSGK